MAADVQWKFVNEAHETLYREARAMLDEEIAREQREAERLYADWQYLPERERSAKVAWLQTHFRECRRPYEKMLTDILALCPMVHIVPKSMLS